jgi:hypothetical protein
MDENEAIPRRRFPKKMKSLASPQPRIASANIFATGRVQLVPDVARQLHPRLRGTSSHREKWRRLRLITRFNFRRHDLDDRNSENSGDKNGGGGALQGSRNYCGHRPQVSTQIFETEMRAGTGARTQRQGRNPNRDYQNSDGERPGEIVDLFDCVEPVPFCFNESAKVRMRLVVRARAIAMNRSAIRRSGRSKNHSPIARPNMIPACKERIPLQASVMPTTPVRSVIAPPVVCAGVPNQCKNTVVPAATACISPAVIGCSKRGGHGTAVRKNKTGNNSASSSVFPPANQQRGA